MAIWDYMSMKKVGIPLVKNYLGISQQEANEKATAQNIASQKEFAKYGIRWKVADARAANISPLAALGAPTHSFQSQPIGKVPDYGISKIGQNISRAISTQMTKPERQRMLLENQLLGEQIRGQKLANDKIDNTSPPMPMPDNPEPAGHNISNVVVKPAEVVSSKQPGVTAGTQALYTDYTDDNGEIWRMPQEKASEVISESLPFAIRMGWKQGKQTAQSWWAALSPKYRKTFKKQLRKVRPKSPHKDYEYRWNLAAAAWRLVPKSNRMYIFDKPMNKEQDVPYRRYPIPKRR